MGSICVDRPGGEALRVAPLVSIASAGLSLLIEFLQVYFPPRTVSINDLVIQASGGTLKRYPSGSLRVSESRIGCDG